MRIKWFSLVRITGLLLVLLYHFFKNAFPGGFIGVDIFFTFSGYLITALMIDEYARSQKFDLKGFYRRRFYRIVPPLVLMVLLTMPFVFLVRRDFIVGIGYQIAAAIGFTTNFYEILTGGNYEAQFIPHLFVHTWSLAIEVHFYLIWGLLIWFLSKRHYKQKRFRGNVFLISTAFFLISFLTMFVRAFFVSNVSSIYFSTLSHSFPFFLGAITATLTGIKETTSQFKQNVISWSRKKVIAAMAVSFLLLLLLSFVLNFNHKVTYLLGFLISSILGIVMIYAARVLNDQTPQVKEPLAITYLADISYGIYLFHWPFYIIFSQLMANGFAVLLTVLFSVIFSTFSYYIIEPYIAGKQSSLFGLEIDLKPYKYWVLGVLATLILLTVGTSVFAPKVGDFETDLLVNTLKQEQTKINQTHTLAAGDASALSNVAVIGDSVALRSSAAFSSILSEAQLDASVSRNFDQAFEIMENQIKSNTLANTLVLAVGVNSLDNYEKDLQQFIDKLPAGHRLVLVTPYNARNATQASTVRDYERSLAKKYSYITVADWYQVAMAHPEIWGGTDGVHYSDADDTGAKLYVENIQRAIQRAAKRDAKK